ncbi:LysR family transcriptional regulator [Priestia endophytica]|uniref:LysR family transcriptional regulator n=1 Tax=Priestia endophytica TaxID=135735 RepID=UPI00227E9B11|nr:LysR family transcriptional regulator [Priestia endophytica]MCY8234546.1 LysR family transcriptional regulator [Priestia endophytica]
MDIRQMTYFIAIAEEGTITKAAERLHMAQPPLSRQVQGMEEELGVMLFERNKKKRMTLTPEGELFLNRAREVVNKMEDTVKEVKELQNSEEGKLSVGATIYSAALLVKSIVSYKEKHPNFTFQVWEDEPTRLEELLESRKIDVVLTTTLFSNENVITKQLSEDPCVVVVPKNHPSTEPVSMETLASLPLVLLRTNYGKGIYDSILVEFERLNLHPTLFCECHDSATLLNLVSAGFGATILPCSMLSLHGLNDLKTLSIESNPFILKTSLIYRKGYVSKAAQEFIQAFEEFQDGQS